VIDALFHLFFSRGVPEHIHSDNGPEFIAKAVRDRIAAVGATTAHIAPRNQQPKYRPKDQLCLRNKFDGENRDLDQ